MTWTCVKCRKQMTSLKECTDHILETSGHTMFDPNAGTPAELDMSFLLRGELHNCFDESLIQLSEWSLKTHHVMGDMMTLTCSGDGVCKCPIDGRDECKLEFQEHGKIGYHEFHSQTRWHRFTLYANLPLIELLFSKGYPKIVSSLKERVEIEQRQFKELEKQGKAFRLDYMRTRAEEGQSWNTVAICQGCKRYFPFKMLLGTVPQKIPKNFFAIAFNCKACGWKGQLGPSDFRDRGQFMEDLLTAVMAKSEEDAEKYSALVGNEPTGIYG